MRTIALMLAFSLTAVAAGSDFGYTTAFPSTQNNLRGKQVATQVNLPEDGTVTSITAYVGGQGGKNVRYALYADAGGEPGALLAETTTAVTTAAMAWLEIELPDTIVSAGTYWLALSFDHNNQSYAYNASGGATRYNDHDGETNGYIDPWGVSTTVNAHQISIYATYASGGCTTFGYATAFASEGTANAVQVATRATLEEAGLLTAVTAYVGRKAAKNVRYAVYTDVSGEPGALIVESSIGLTGASMDWVELPVPPTYLYPGAYWLAVSLEQSQQMYGYDASGGASRERSHAAVMNGFLNPWGASEAANTRRVSIQGIVDCNAPPPTVFTDVSVSVGFDVQTTAATDDGSGLHWGDLDDDGDLDAVITGNVARVLNSTGAGASFFVSTLGSGDAAGQGGFLDADHDGDLDFWHRDLVLYRNDGSGALSDAGNLGFIEPATNESVAIADVDGDGWCDVVMFSGTNGNWIGHHQRSSTPALSGTDDAAAGLNDIGDYGDGDYCSSGDVNDDGGVDFFYHYGGGKLFLSDGDGTYTESASGISVVTGESEKIGSAWGDYDGDGDLDLFVPRYASGSPGSLWRNDAGSFTNVAASAGITDTSGQRSACWGDYDNDGDLDLYVVTHSSGPNLLYQNDGDATFTATSVGADASGDGHDAVFVDYDNDGDLDLAVTRQGTTNVLLRNGTDTTDFLKVRVLGWGAWGTNKAGIGVKVELYDGTGTSLLARRDVGAARGYAGSEPLWVHFGGVNSTTTYVVRVHFLSGAVSTTLVPGATTTTIGSTTISQMLTVTEGQPDLKLIRWQESDPLN